LLLLLLLLVCNILFIVGFINYPIRQQQRCATDVFDFDEDPTHDSMWKLAATTNGWL
jgi:hypothetical protein